MSKIDKELIDPTVEPDSEKIHRTIRASLAAVPVLGGTSVEIFNALIEPPMAKRKTEWMIQVTDALNSLFEKGILTEQDLQHNEKFFTTLVHASTIAIRNHDQKKLEALRNVVLNSALPNAPDDTLQQLLLNLIDSCTSWHIALLKLFQNPKQWAIENNHRFPDWQGGSLDSVIESAFPELKGHWNLYQLIWQELYRNGLVSTDRLQTIISGYAMLAKQTTGMGDSFINFISSPNI